MKNEAIKIFQKRKNDILEIWTNLQAEDEVLRNDLMTNEDLRAQSEELLTALISNLDDKNFEKAKGENFGEVNEVLASISISRAKQGFSPRETGTYIFS